MHLPGPPFDFEKQAERRHQKTPLKSAVPTPAFIRPDGLQPHPSKPNELNQYPPLRPRLKPPTVKRTSPYAWFVGIFCALFWTAIILGGLAILIIYLIFRPRNPHLDIPQATLNAAYLDVDVDSNTTLLNADFTLLANFSNPNHKVDVVYTLVELDLYFGATLVAVAAVDPFSERRGESALRSVHMMASQVPMPDNEVAEWRRQKEGAAAGGGNVMALELQGRMRARSELGGWLRFSYWLHCRCRILMGAPPDGALKGVYCKTKRKLI